MMTPPDESSKPLCAFVLKKKKKAHPVCDVAEFQKQTSGSMT